MDSLELAITPLARDVEDRSRSFEPLLPEGAPLAMHVQSLDQASRSLDAVKTSPENIGARRALFLGTTLLMTVAATWITCRALAVDTLSALDLVILAVFTCLFGWTAASFITALAGLWVSLSRRQTCPLGIDPAAAPPRIWTRTALLAPIFNEETHLVFGKLQAMLESIEATGQERGFDLFILSDTTEPSLWTVERRAVEELRRRMGSTARVFYRRRVDNAERKAGNIADWVRRFGGAYHFMVILDADSLMTGDTLVRLAGAMERHPGVGLIQTAPVIANRKSLFGRLQQFASSVYGPLMARGLAWWSGGEGNYWGHNAIIACGLSPVTPACRDCRGASRSAAPSSVTISSRRRFCGGGAGPCTPPRSSAAVTRNAPRRWLTFSLATAAGARAIFSTWASSAPRDCTG